MATKPGLGRQAPASKRPALTLTEFVRAKKRAACPVCGLTEDVRSQLIEARTKKIKRAEQLEWLAVQHQIKLTGAELDCHYSGKHEQ